MNAEIERDLAVEMVERREGDKRLQQTLRSMCLKLDKLIEKEDIQDRYCRGRADYVHGEIDKKVSFALFRWMITACIVGVVGVSASTYRNAGNIMDNKHHIIQIEEKIPVYHPIVFPEKR